MHEPFKVGLLSLEPWDEVWRRNQHLGARLVRAGVISSLLFITPPAGGFALRARRHSPIPGVQVLTPPLWIPRRYGGYRVLGWWLRRVLRNVDALWINDPVAGVAVMKPGNPAVYDVTDDWREMEQSQAQRRRVVAAEDELAVSATTVVCSDVLAGRWSTRYGIRATVIQNGVDVAAIRGAEPTALPGRGPHAVYVGTLHANRIDVDLVAELADRWPGTIHLVGPNHLGVQARSRLLSKRVHMHGPKPAEQVPIWLVSADVLICPHVVDSFTLSLDAIKSHEYLATDRPVVATKSSGFQSMTAPGLVAADRRDFVQAVLLAADSGPSQRHFDADWSDTARQFGAMLSRSLAGVNGGPSGRWPLDLTDIRKRGGRSKIHSKL